ncbi:MAG: DUF1761 domain-containing protein [Candidatus Woesearchaeota archaeon]|nr:DUF1761 domain-containing protein [Candidatus Woesearchaeota archaeon]
MVNYLAVVVAAVVSMVVGGLWYSPVLFGNMWMKLSGIDKKKMKQLQKKAVRGYVLMFVSSFVMAFVLAEFVRVGNIGTFADGAKLAGWIWLGFLAPLTFGPFMWEGKPLKLCVLNAAYWLVTLPLMAGVLAVWP